MGSSCSQLILALFQKIIYVKTKNDNKIKERKEAAGTSRERNVAAGVVRSESKGERLPAATIAQHIHELPLCLSVD